MTPSPALLNRHAPLAPVAHCPPLLAHQSADVFALWQAWEEECGALQDVPYWAIVWPAAQLLAQYLLANRDLLVGRTVLDCGCGGGVTTVAASLCGARRAVGGDLDPFAIAVARGNAQANGANAEFVCQDVVPLCAPRQFDLILVADLFYQREFSRLLFAALRQAHAEGCLVLIADSGRPFLPKEDLLLLHGQVIPTSLAVEGCEERTVNIYKFR